MSDTPPFLRLSDLVLELHALTHGSRMAAGGDTTAPLRQTIRDQAADLRLRAAALAVLQWGPEQTRAIPSVVNVAALALALQRWHRVHVVRPAAAALVHETDLHALPGEAPRILRGPWLLEAHRPETGDRLFGETVCLGGYPLDGRIYLVGLEYPDGALVAGWAPAWGERDIETALPEREQSPLVEDVDAHHEWAREAARFAVVFGALLDADGAPVRSRDEERWEGGGKRQPKGTAAINVRHVYLSEASPRGWPRRAGGGPDAGSVPGGGERVAVDQVPVRGHLKRQPHGPGGMLRKWVWISGYEARRWVAPRPGRVIVH